MDRISTLTHRTRDGLELTRVHAVSPVAIPVCAAPGSSVVPNSDATGFGIRWGMTTKRPARLLGTTT